MPDRVYHGNGKSNIWWKLDMAWLWLSKPRWMLRMRRQERDYREHGIPIRPHTFGPGDDHA